MKASILLISAIILNTIFILAQPIAELIQGINTWIFAGIESILLLGYYMLDSLKRLHKSLELDLGDLNVFVFKGKTKHNLF